MARKHKYETRTTWTGDRGQGTADYRSYDRTLETTCPERPAIPGSSDPAFRGDADRWNPELLLVAALSQCHMLSYLHRCAVGGVVVTGYEDAAEGVMVETDDGGGHFEDVVLRPIVTVAEAGDGRDRAGPARRGGSSVFHRGVGQLPRAARAAGSRWALEVPAHDLVGPVRLADLAARRELRHVGLDVEDQRARRWHRGRGEAQCRALECRAARTWTCRGGWGGSWPAGRRCRRPASPGCRGARRAPGPRSPGPRGGRGRRPRGGWKGACHGDGVGPEAAASNVMVVSTASQSSSNGSRREEATRPMAATENVSTARVCQTAAGRSA